MISRRALFGVSAGAAATAVVPPARSEVVVGLDFGKQPAALILGPADAEWAEACAEVMKQRFPMEWMVDIRFDNWCKCGRCT